MARTFKFVARRRLGRRVLVGLLAIAASGGGRPCWGDPVDSPVPSTWKSRKATTTANAAATPSSAPPQRFAQDATTGALRWRNPDDDSSAGDSAAEPPANGAKSSIVERGAALERPAIAPRRAAVEASARSAEKFRSNLRSEETDNRKASSGISSASRRVVRPQPVSQAAWFTDAATTANVPPATTSTVRPAPVDVRPATVDVETSSAPGDSKSSLKIIDVEIVDYTAETSRAPRADMAVRQAQAYEPAPSSRRRSSERSISDRETRERTRFEVLNVAQEARDPFREDAYDERLPSSPRGPRPQDAMSEEPTLPEPQSTTPSPSDRPGASRRSPSGDGSMLNLEPNPLPGDTPDTDTADSLPPPAPKEAQPSPCSKEKGDCADALGRLKSNTIDHISLNIRISGAEGSDFPCECTLGAEQFRWRKWEATCYTWKANGQCHKPFYFEDAQLERYGHQWNPILQPFLSAGHFYANVLLLPYHMAIWAPNECIYTLGYYRPGSCAPYVIEPFPLSLKGALFEGSAIFTGAWVFGFFVHP